MECCSCSIAGYRAVFRNRKHKRMELVLPGERRRKDETERAATTLSRRSFVMRGVVGTSFVALGGKLWRMEISRGHAYQAVAEGNVLRFERLNAARGRIIDRNGEPLAESRRSWTV